MIHPEIIDLFNFIVEYNGFIAKKKKEVNGYFGKNKVKSIADLKRILIGDELNELYQYFSKLNKLLINSKFDFPITLNISYWKEMKKIIRDNPRADLQIISYEANELINKIKRDIEVIDNDEFIQEVQNIRKKLIEFEPWKTEAPSA
ncbi:MULTISPECIES: hypothetical protein [unclassified Lebetimonas]|uniref:hypothetical protein n=1 Tax=unclassified Lebetimonas TaxID=2648158 RepID=UPI0004639305|nr:MULTISPECIES: hypothetical protein [unclassified Lebetimonas]